jgi:hypothetical protein
VSNAVSAAQPLSTEESEGPRWSTLRRLGFRFVCIFVLLAVGNNYEPWMVIPGINSILSSAVVTPLSKAAQWVAIHLFHVAGIAAIPHPTDSRDTVLCWITILLIIILSVAGAALWTLLDRRRSNNTGAVVWMRYLLRLSLVFIMARYAIFKIFPLQMSRPSLAVLNEPVGQSSPMTLLWTLVGLNPVYQITSGLLEGACALLLFFRRTALLGALLGIIIMTNVTLLNFCYDVPVKLGALLILFAFFVLAWPDLHSLRIFFLQQAPSRLGSVWRPQWKTKTSFRIATAAEMAYLFLSLYFLLPVSYRLALQEAANWRAPSPLAGEWRVDSATRVVNGQMTDAAVLTAEGSPMTALFLEPDGRVMARSADGRLWRAGAIIDTSQHLLSLYSGYFDGTRFQARYRYSQAGANQLQLAPANGAKSEASTVSLTRVPLPATYPLLQAKFKWVQEWALER